MAGPYARAVSGDPLRPIGVVLAGGLGRRIGGAKAVVQLGGRPLISYPLAAMRAAVGEVAVVAKADTVLPALDGVAVWIEPASPRHPLVGIVHALRRAGGRPVLVCAADLPFVTAAALTQLALADPQGTPAVIASSARGGPQPLLGCYQPTAAGLLAAAALTATGPVRAAVGAIGPRLLELADGRVLFNVNSEADLARAEDLASRR
jgi:molybdopterin-guanine dinucleotide biosynthesis protein A